MAQQNFRSTRSRVGGVAIATWFGLMLAIGASLLAKHVVALPAPREVRLEASMATLRHPEERDRWVAVHVLYAECRCSQRVVDQLLSTARPVDFAEIVLWVGEAEPPKDLDARFDVRRVKSRDLASYGIEAAPLLVAIDPVGHVRYVGGYTTRKQGPEIEDLRLLLLARDAQRVDSLPLFGCAVSERLKRDLSIFSSP
jgi:hypothetical protein